MTDPGTDPKNSTSDAPWRAALAQIAPAVLDRATTLARVRARVEEAAAAGARLVVFGEALVPGYPVWLDRADGARFESAEQKEIHARYVDQSVHIDHGQLDELRQVCGDLGIAASLGVMERTHERGESLFCSSVLVTADGTLVPVHRKLMPTYEERLAWAHGDAAGLRTHALGPFQCGRLLCWENWMPAARAALHGDGETLHLAHWPGGAHNTEPTTRFLAREGRSFVLAASGFLRASDLPDDLPALDRIAPDPNEVILNGGSAAAGPDGEWIVEPIVGEEALVTVDLDPALVRRERQNFDPAGHYARPDVLRLTVDRRRQRTVEFVDGP